MIPEKWSLLNSRLQDTCSGLANSSTDGPPFEVEQMKSKGLVRDCRQS